jgi:hypothetical protein
LCVRQALPGVARNRPVHGWNSGTRVPGLRLAAEDVHFLWRLQRLGHSRRQRLQRLRQAKAVASTRKFDRNGDWHYFTQMPAMAIKSLGSSRKLTDFARRYWYEDR